MTEAVAGLRYCSDRMRIHSSLELRVAADGSGGRDGRLAHGERRRQSSRPAAPARPNILLIQADDLGYGDLSAYGQGRFETPALDRLAREGIRFTQYYSGSTVCAPSRAALMTGLHTGHGWIRGNGEIPLRPEDVTIAELLRKSGYRTAVIGKWGLGTPGTTGEPGKKGFDHSFGFLDHRHAHRQYTDHLWRNGQKVETDLERDYVNDLFTKEAAGVHRARRQAAVLHLHELHGAACGAARAGGYGGAISRSLPREAVREREG